MAEAGSHSIAMIADRFEGLGGEFRTEADEIAARTRNCRALLFDWDGVFNSGSKGGGSASKFGEPDSMGTNMLRYGLWDDIWKYVDRDEVREIFPSLDLPDNLRVAWGRMLKIEAPVT